MTQEYIDYGGLLDESAVLTWVAMSNVLPEHRRNVTMLTVITDGQALAHYTIMNKWIVKTVGIMALRGSEGSIEAGLLAYLGFMYMKEKAGNERAVGTLGFGAGMWADIKSWQKFITLVAIQGNAYLYFEQFGSDESIALHAKNEDSKVSRVVLTWRSYALENKTQESTKSKELSMFNVAAADWFDNTTFRINLFRNVETMIADELNTFFDEIFTSTQDFVFGILLTLVFLTLLTLYVGIKGIRLLLRSQAMGNYSGMDKKKRRRRRKKKVEGK
jgi:methyl-accepting chemotaxis protein